MGDPIDLMPFYPYLREAARNGGKTAWVGWLTGFFLTGLGLLDSAILLTMGLVTLAAMAVWIAHEVREMRRYERLGRSGTESDREDDRWR